MSTPEVFTPQSIMVSKNAILKVKALLQEEGNLHLKFRVFISGGGCSGFQYGFKFDESITDDDAVITESGVTVIIDSMSYTYLIGAQIDYQETLEGSKFFVNNPHAKTTCGCGLSFSI